MGLVQDMQDEAVRRLARLSYIAQRMEQILLDGYGKSILTHAQLVNHAYVVASQEFDNNRPASIDK